MNQKKCPKCGELNPPEAVMCWACYTPLSGAPSSSAPGNVAPARGGKEEKGKKAIATWQIGLFAVALLGGLGFGAKTMFGGSSSSSDDSDSNTVTVPKSTKPMTNTTTTGTTINIPAPTISTGGTPTNPPPAPTPQAIRFSVVAAPNPRYTWGTMAIVAADPNITASQAAGMAIMVRQQMMRNKKWAILHIYVFSDRDSGIQFRRYQTGRKAAPLESDDYSQLSGIWPNCIVRYEYNRGAESFLYPNKSPNGWWDIQPVYARARR